MLNGSQLLAKVKALHATTMPKEITETDEYAYTIEKSRFGLYTSVLDDGTRMVTGATEEATRWVTDNIHIPLLKGEFDGYTSVPRSGVVEGKL